MGLLDLFSRKNSGAKAPAAVPAAAPALGSLFAPEPVKTKPGKTGPAAAPAGMSLFEKDDDDDGRDKVAWQDASKANSAVAREWMERLERGHAILQEVLPNPPKWDLEDSISQPLMLALCKGATKMAVCFAGNAKGFATPEDMREYPDLHVLGMRDPTRCFCLAGVPGLGETYEDCVANIKRLAEHLGVKEIYCFGASAGGYPSLRYALDLEAVSVLSFSPPTSLNIDDDPGAPMSRYPQLVGLYKRARHMGADLVPMYRSRRPRPTATIVYSEGHKRDTMLALRMVGVPHVELIKIHEDAGHRTLSWLQDNGGIREYLIKLFEGKQVTADTI